tara:strand:+ start:432 stop:1685 length:1254 start_codon:yes stop_codon:yes gene_type:complete
MDIKRKNNKHDSLKHKVKIFGIIIAVCIGLLFYVSTLEPAALSVPKSQLWIDTVKYGDMIQEVRGPGRLVSNEIRVLAAESNARVDEVYLNPGKQVTPDSKILKLSNPNLLEQLSAAELNLANHKVEYATQKAVFERQLIEQQKALAEAEVQYKISAIQTERELKLVGKGIIPEVQAHRNRLVTDQMRYLVQLEKEQLKSLNESIKIQLNASVMQREVLESTLKLRQSQVEGLTVTAKQAGILQDVSVEVGQQVLAGTNLARIAGTQDIVAQLRIPESQINDVKLGLSAEVDTRNGLIKGRVSRIDPGVENGSILVDITFTEQLPANARPGLSVDGLIQVDKLTSILYVGRPARSRGYSEINLFRVDSQNGTAESISVELGRVSATNVEILAGLEKGERVILSDMTEWSGHSIIKIN